MFPEEEPREPCSRGNKPQSFLWHQSFLCLIIPCNLKNVDAMCTKIGCGIKMHDLIMCECSVQDNNVEIRDEMIVMLGHDVVSLRSYAVLLPKGIIVFFHLSSESVTRQLKCISSFNLSFIFSERP